MNKRLAVLLLRVAGKPDQPTKAYAEQLFTGAGRGTRNLVDYYDDMSHGRLDLGQSQVFDWIDYGHTNQDLNDVWATAKADRKKTLLDGGAAEADAEAGASGYANGFKRDKLKQWGREAAAKAGYVLDNFDVIVFVFNQPVDYFGSDGETVVNWDDSNGHMFFSVDLTGVSHEVGHGLGLASHSRLEGSADEYADHWDIMSAYDGIYYVQPNAVPAPSYYTFGPGLNAVNMEIVGWLDQTRVFTGSGSVSFRLRPLHRRDLTGWLAARLQVGYETIYVEFRIDDRWDVATPHPCVLLHRRSTHPGDGRPCSELLLAARDAKPGPRPDLREGESLVMGDPGDLLGYFAKLTVTQIDIATQEALVDVYIRQRRRYEVEGVSIGGVNVDGGGWVWTPGRGLVKVPPRSPFLRVVEMVAEAEVLQGIDATERGGSLERLSTERLMQARDLLVAIVDARTQPKVPAPVTRRRSE